MRIELDMGLTSLAGKKPVNEDFAAALLPGPGEVALGAIAAIADGVSTGGMGKEAAQTTVTSLVRDYYGTPQTWDTTVALDRIIGAQNLWLAGINRRRHPALGLTTLTALVLRGHTYTLAHVGDTRAYLLRDGQLTQLTQDHVVDHPDFHHQLLRSLGAEDRIAVDYSQGELLVGDIFLLLSDGVHGVMNEQRLVTVSTATPSDTSNTIPSDAAPPASPAQAISAALVAAALQRGSSDNLTALVVRVLGLTDATLSDETRAAQARPIPPRLNVGDTLDGLRVLQLVADNGVNLVYQVQSQTPSATLPGWRRPGVAAAQEGKLYALKTLHPARAADTQERAMLAHEAWLAQCLSSSWAADHLVQLHPQLPNGQSPSAYYLLYDWHAGETLQQLIDRHHPVSPQQTVVLATQALKALGRLHRQSVIHRDIKPANLHLGQDSVLRLLDLGVALSGREPLALRRLHAGTPSYINPEQWGFAITASGVITEGTQEPPNAQSDLFALGVTLYQLLTNGKLPYGEVLPYQSGRYFRDPIAPSRHQPEVPIWLDHIALKAVARDQRQRFETAEEMLLALERGAARPLSAQRATPLLQRDPTMRWKLLLALSAVFNFLLVYWLLFLPK